MHTERKVARRAAFTLVELLVVMAIIALLAGLLTPAIIGAMNKAHEAATMARIQECQIAATSFFNDRGDYPPTHWDELDNIFKYDANGDGVLENGPGGADDCFAGLDATTDPNTINEGIEVFLACVASRTGGYLDPSGDWLRNVDFTNGNGDRDNASDDVAKATNWSIAPTTTNDPVYELVDWWGNPLVYFHSRDYSAYDGWDDVAGAWADPTDPADAGQAIWYEDSENVQVPCYARSIGGFMTLNYPNLDSFQLYSWGRDGVPGREDDPVTNPATTPFPTGSDAGYWPGWTAESGNLCNWEE